MFRDTEFSLDVLRPRVCSARITNSRYVYAYCPNVAFYFQSLCVVERQQCWVLYVDVLILECGGNLYDAISIGVKAALFNVRLPGKWVAPVHMEPHIDRMFI